MTKDEALKMAIDWIEGTKRDFNDETLEACKQALEQKEQKPVGEVVEDRLAAWSKPYAKVKWFVEDFEIGTEFYTSPPDQSAKIAELEKELIFAKKYIEALELNIELRIKK